MSNLISASVSEEFGLTVASSDGFTGEHNAETLEIDVSPLAEQDYDYYVLIFDDMSVNGIIRSNEIRSSEDYPAYLDGEAIICPLSSQLTSTGRLKIQLEAHKATDSGSVIKKTSVASLEFKPSIMSTSDIFFDTSSQTRLDILEKRLSQAEAMLESISDIPLATTQTVGGMKLLASSPVQLNANGEAVLKLSEISDIALDAKIITAFLQTSTDVKCIYQNSCEEDTRTLLNSTAKISHGILNYVIFYSEASGKIEYRNGNGEKIVLEANSNFIYLFKGTGSDFTVTAYDKSKAVELLLKGVQ